MTVLQQISDGRAVSGAACDRAASASAIVAVDVGITCQP